MIQPKWLIETTTATAALMGVLILSETSETSAYVFDTVGTRKRLFYSFSIALGISAEFPAKFPSEYLSNRYEKFSMETNPSSNVILCLIMNIFGSPPLVSAQ